MPNVVLERPKMSRSMWEALKSHILRERQRKKQELEADAEVERQRKERERQQKQEAMTLTETREQITKLDNHLSELKEEKHQLFLQLKKVLNEDETRRRQLMNKEAGEMMGMYLPQQVSSHQMFLQPVALTRLPQYKIAPGIQQHNPQHNPHALLPQVAGIKRSRSPSPPPQNYKFGPFKPPPQAMHSYPHRGLQYFPPPPSSHSQQPPPSQPQQIQSQNSSVAYSTHHSSPQPPPALYTYSTSSHHTRSPQTGRDEPPKPMQPGLYLHHGHGQMPRGFVLHQSVEQHGPPPTQHKFVDENPKYYPSNAHQLHGHGRPPGHMNLHPVISIQPPQGVSGGITSGYPIRTTPSASSFQGRPPSPHVVYTGQGGPPRLAYAHPHSQQALSSHGQAHQSVPGSRTYNLPPGMN